MNVRQECPELETMGARPPQLDGDKIAAHVANLSRAPFRDVLERLLGAEPSPEKVREFAEKYPDRWAQACAIFGRLGGYHENAQVSHHHTHAMIELTQLSDAELSDRLQTALAKLGISVNAGETIDLKALPKNGS